jgi:hypothetical protein
MRKKRKQWRSHDPQVGLANSRLEICGPTPGYWVTSLLPFKPASKASPLP